MEHFENIKASTDPVVGKYYLSSQKKITSITWFKCKSANSDILSLKNPHTNKF